MKELKRASAWSGAILVAGILLGNNPAYATPISIGELVTNGGFGTILSPSLTGWTPSSGPGVNPRFGVDVINSLGFGNTGFNLFFSSPFAVLGDNSGFIGGAPDAGTFSISQDIVLPEMQGTQHIKSYDLNISFRTVFDGDDSTNPNDTKDIFLASFGGISLFSQDSAPLPNCGPLIFCSNNQIINNPFTGQILGLSPGTYTLIFSLNEAAGGATNTAAGIDSVSITGTANPIPEPASLALLGAGLIGFGFMRRRKA